MNSAYTIIKASFFKRTAALIFDLIIGFVLFVGVENLIMHPIVNAAYQYDELDHQFEDKLVEYGVGYYDSKTNEFKFVQFETIEERNAHMDEFNKDKEAVAIRTKLDSINLLKVTMDFMVSEFLVFCLMPLILKNGQTLGKKLMKLALVSTNEVKVKGWNVFARWAVGIFAFETMINLAFVAFFIIPLPLIVSIIMAAVSRKGMALHDYIGGTIVVDLNNTVILDSVEERRKRILEEKEAYATHQQKKMISQKEIEENRL